MKNNTNKIKVGILGYGNLGKGVELAIEQNTDMELVCIFTRRNPNAIKTITNTKVESVDNIEEYKEKIDVLILCSGSATDLPEQTPKYAKLFNVIDSYDTHAKIYEHYTNVNNSAIEGNNIALISCGWDPGLFSFNRLMSECIIPNGNTYTFWGPGVSQGHSDALRRISGVKDAIQYTIPKEEAITSILNNNLNKELTTRDKHRRECYVVLEDDVSNKQIQEIQKQIISMPYYFDEYDTTVYYITEEELKQNHSKMPHGGTVIRTGKTNQDNNQIIQYTLKLNSNPEFTGSVLVAYTRAIYKLHQQGQKGCKTILDIPPIYLTNKTNEEVLNKIL